MKLPKLIRVSGIAVLILVFIIVGAVILFDRYAEKIVETYLQKYYTGSELSQVYDIKYDGIGIGLISGKVHLKGVKISPKSTFFDTPDSLRFKYPLLLELNLQKLSISGLTRNLSGDLGRISLQSVGIDEPSIKLIDHLTAKEKKMILELKKQGLPDTLTKKTALPHIIVDELLVSEGQFEFYDRNHKKSVFSVGNVTIAGDAIDFKPNEKGKIVFSEKSGTLTLGFKNINYLTNDGFYKINLGNLEINLPEFVIIAENFKLIPQYDKQSFGRKFRRQTDRMDVAAKKITIGKWDIEKWQNEGQIWIDEIVVDGVMLDIYRDKSVEPDLTIFPKLPQEALASMDVGLNIGAVRVTNAEIFYQEQIAGASEAGKVPIVNMQATMNNVTNIETVKNTSGHMKWELTGKVFGHGSYEVLIDFHGSSHPADFSFSGSIGGMDMTLLNQMIVPNEHIRIDSGYMVSTTFNVNASRTNATGEMHLQYKDLKITLLKDKDEEGLKDRGLFSSLANATIRIFKLDKKTGDVETAYIHYDRDLNKGVFNYIIKSLLNGVMASVLPSKNITPEEQKKKQEKENRKKARQERKKK
ncbi:MAG: hypothetical protein IH598_10305 [Bacteroidales bacterium]|nr:hypothetical protein [Bacteroidales bacterium]